MVVRWFHGALYCFTLLNNYYAWIWFQSRSDGLIWGVLMSVQLVMQVWIGHSKSCWQHRKRVYVCTLYCLTETVTLWETLLHECISDTGCQLLYISSHTQQVLWAPEVGIHRVFGSIVGGFKNESQKNHVPQLEIAHNQTKGLGLIHQSPSKKSVTSIIKDTKFYCSKK